MTPEAGQDLTPEISIVVPVLNEHRLLRTFVAAVSAELQAIGLDSYEIVVVDDGSTDDTWQLASELAEEGKVVAVRLNRNVGKEAALAAGLAHARGAAHVPMDVDMQDPPWLLAEMIARWRDGAKMVVCRRKNRNDSRVKRWTASLFYWVAAKGSHVEIPRQVGDFRLVDRTVTERFLSLSERNRFNKGLFALVAPKDWELVEYERPNARLDDRPRQSLGRLIALGVDGIVSFSTWPLRLLSLLGFAAVIMSVVGALACVALRWWDILEVPGQATVVLVGLFLAGFQALSIGVLGEYIARILIEVKHRPLFIVDSLVAGGDKRGRGDEASGQTVIRIPETQVESGGDH